MSNPFKNIQGETAWRAPSNIALIKYWGKYGNQLPRNASISFTLSNAYTDTSVKYKAKETADNRIDLEFLFEGKENPKFAEKIQKFLESIIPHFPFLPHFSLEINSSNSFPHSTGIASSASSMAALALCLTSIENELDGGMYPALFYEKASMIARLGSGSACRSVYPHLAVWGKQPNIQFSSNEHAIPFGDQVHPIFKTFKDAILIVSSDEKSVSSRAGHALMEGNPYAESRYKQAETNLTNLVSAMKDGNLEKFGEIVENEALTLHALMMCSNPSFILIKPNTLKIIDLIKTYRTEKGVPLYYTLDAGPNLHLLYPSENAKEVETFIQQELLKYCESEKVIYDEVGKGATKLK
ncbi:MAG: diphosphomevalonate decarboxylase [Chitinophagales bacterium]